MNSFDNPRVINNFNIIYEAIAKPIRFTLPFLSAKPVLSLPAWRRQVEVLKINRLRVNCSG
jgi:hypothetical protein